MNVKRMPAAIRAFALALACLLAGCAGGQTDRAGSASGDRDAAQMTQGASNASSATASSDASQDGAASVQDADQEQSQSQDATAEDAVEAPESESTEGAHGANGVSDVQGVSCWSVRGRIRRADLGRGERLCRRRRSGGRSRAMAQKVCLRRQCGVIAFARRFARRQKRVERTPKRYLVLTKRTANDSDLVFC